MVFIDADKRSITRPTMSCVWSLSAKDGIILFDNVSVERGCR